ncbi:PREDICTED: uncharacterized protein LOC107349236 isoform X2 [Acropora digitifera]|uniref:uncharacterized protein LOC107349236 isoform X2 n=1 Tax=Acropora digitifera TaxID=70779 RepID=UPI00077B17AF|nr:PREDICTED: uncharacterized protein LOC107349236 isoform X2 [Acropora digitifera]
MTSSEGAATPGGSLAVGQIAFRVLRPKAVFSVGTCISLDSEKVRRGDVVISSKLTTAEGFKVPVSPRLGHLVKDAPYGWVPPLENPGKSEVNIHPNGDILSLSLTLRRRYDDICKEYPGAVAIETEGKGSLVTETTTATAQAVVAVNARERGPNSISEAVFHSDVTTVQQHIVGDVVSSGRENEIKRKGPSHPSVNSTERRHRQNAGILERVDHGILDQGASLLTSNRLSSAVDSQSRIKESRGKKPLHPLVSITPERERQNRDIPEIVDHGTSDEGAPLLTSNRLSSAMDSQSRIKESRGNRPLYPLVTITPERERQNRDIPERVDYGTFDRGYSSLRSYQLESSIAAYAMIQQGGVDHGTSDQGDSLLTSNRLSSATNSQIIFEPSTGKVYERVVTQDGYSQTESRGKSPWDRLATVTPERERQKREIPDIDADIQRKRPSHPLVTTSERQRPNASAGWEGMRDLFKTPTAPHQAVAANNLGYQGLSATSETRETLQQRILDDVMTSGSENGSQDVRHGASRVQQPSLREYGESYVKVLIDSNNGLKERKKKVMEEFLIKTVQNYLEFYDRSGDNDEQAMKSLTDHLISVYWVHLGTVGLGSIFISLECPTLDSLEHLWSDYLTGHLHMLTERYLVPDEVKEKLKLEGNILKTTIEEQNYLNCKKALVELRSTYSAVIDISSVIQWLKGEYNRRAEFSPLLRSKGVKLQLEDLYARLSVVSSLYSKSSEIGVKDIFSSSRKGEDSMVLFEAYEGIGKSFFCLKLAQDWANDAMPSTFPIFELVLLLKCKDIEGHIMDAISEQLLPRSLEDKMKDNFLKFIGDASNQERILVILDGWNELPEESKHHVDNVLARRVLKCCYVLVTTRGRPELQKRFKFNLCLRMKALSEVDSFDYIRKHFKSIGTEQSSKGESLIQEIKGNRLLQDLRSNRPNLFLLCLLCEDHEGKLPSSSSGLYQTLVRYLWRRYCAKQKLKTDEEDMDLAKQFEREILAIGELAWKSLLNFRHSFREDDLKLERRDEMSITLGLGFVYKEESLKRSEPHHVFTFVHKTFQDYLAALYVAHNLRGSKFYEPVRNRFIFGQWYRKAFLFVCGILREEASILFRQIGDALQKDWDWSKCSKDAASFFTESWKESGNAESMANTLCSFLPFPRVLHVREHHHKELINVLEACAGFSKVQTPAEVHVAVPFGFQVVENIQRVLAGIPNVKTLILPAVSYSIDRTEVGEVLRASKTLEKVTFALSAGRGEGWASALDVGLGADSSLSSVGLRIDGLLNQSALQAVENLLFNKYLSSLSITIYGDVQESLAKVLARGLAGKSAVKFLDLCVNGMLSFVEAYSLEEGILRNGSLRKVKVSVNGELPVNWQGVGENLHAKLAKKGVVSSIYPNIFSKVKGSQVTSLNPMLLPKTHFVQQNITLNVWGELSGDGSKALSEFLLHTPVSHLTLNIHGQLTDELLRCTARCVKKQKRSSSITVNAWLQMTEKEKNLINELGLDKNPSVSLNVCGTGAPLKKSNDSEVFSSDEPSSLFAFFEEAEKVSPEKVSSKSLSLTINLMPETGGFWLYELRHGLKKVTSLNSLTLAINIYSDTDRLWLYELSEALVESTSLSSLTLALNIYSDTDNFWTYRLVEALAESTSLNSVTLAINIYSDSQWRHKYLHGLIWIESLTECNFLFNIYGKCKPQSFVEIVEK